MPEPLVPADGRLPVDAIREPLLAALDRGPVVLSSPTGSGKSTQVPRWCPGRVLVIEPRRVACRSLAQRVAELEGAPLGEAVGYHVRDERRASQSTRVLFATPGIVLRTLDRLDAVDTLILDELHERGLEIDLLLALILDRRRRGRFTGRLVAMSATLDGDRVAEHLGGEHLHAAGRTFPVDIRHLSKTTLLPDIDGLERRVVSALDAARDLPGDVLVFLPGKGEIASVAKALSGRSDLDVLPLHGGLSLDEQTRVFRPSPRRKVILATNVAETSLTVPGVGVVIDSGLVRRTRYARDRGFLTLVPIALDSADQRSGRAGRTAAGVAFRLWDQAARLEPRTPPEIHRESLVPLVLATAVQDADPRAIPWLDPPKAHAVETAEEELRALGALDGETLTERGRRLFGLPLDAALGRWLVEAETRERSDPSAIGLLADMVDLVAALSTDRPPIDRPSAEPGEEPTIEMLCDAVAMLRAVRGGGSSATETGRWIREARSTRRRLRRLVDLGEASAPSPDEPIDRRRLAATLLAADPRLAHVARRRGRRTGWSNGGTELELGREAGLRQLDDASDAAADAVLVLQTIALGTAREARLVASRVMPIPASWLVEAGLGRDRLATLALREGADGPEIVAAIERVFAKRVLAHRDDVPRGALARDAVAELYLRGTLYGAAERDRNRDALEALRLARRLAEAPDAAPWLAEVTMLVAEQLPPFDAWLRARVDALGVDSGRDIALLDADDFRAPELPAHLHAELDRAWPRRLKVDGVRYRVDYDLERSIVSLHLLAGKPQKLPGRFFLPRFPGFRVQVEHKGAMRTLA